MHDDMTAKAILTRAEIAALDTFDIQQLRKWITGGPPRERTIKAYLQLICNIEDAHRFIASDLRQSLAKNLISDLEESKKESK